MKAIMGASLQGKVVDFWYGLNDNYTIAALTITAFCGRLEGVAHWVFQANWQWLYTNHMPSETTLNPSYAISNHIGRQIQSYLGSLNCRAPLIPIW